MTFGVCQGSLDILVQRTGEQMGEKVTFVQNNFFHDAFFLKALGTVVSLSMCFVMALHIK